MQKRISLAFAFLALLLPGCNRSNAESDKPAGTGATSVRATGTNGAATKRKAPPPPSEDR